MSFREIYVGILRVTLTKFNFKNCEGLTSSVFGIVAVAELSFKFIRVINVADFGREALSD